MICDRCGSTNLDLMVVEYSNNTGHGFFKCYECQECFERNNIKTLTKEEIKTHLKNMRGVKC